MLCPGSECDYLHGRSSKKDCAGCGCQLRAAKEAAKLKGLSSSIEKAKGRVTGDAPAPFGKAQVQQLAVAALKVGSQLHN